MNLNTKTNTPKQILAKVMLVVILLTSVLSLSGCEWENIFTSTTEDVDGGYGCIVNDGWRINDFETLNDLINKKVPDEYYFVTFNFDNKEDYVVNPYYVFLKAILLGLNDRDYLWKTCYIEGSAEIGGPEEENCIKIKYVSFVLEDIEAR